LQNTTGTHAATWRQKLGASIMLSGKAGANLSEHLSGGLL